jgi:prepilin-type N-terminal cleavage/methylation domain-containing protein
MMDRNTRRDGFTLVELMIVVAIIGIITTIAIPAFSRFQLRAKRAEAYTNLEGIAKGEKGYAAEFGIYVTTNGTFPGPLPSVSKRQWDAPSATAFAQVGWKPEGSVYFDYGVNVDNCPAADCFTAEAYGDLDGDGLMSVLSYVQPSSAGVWASEPLAGFAPLFPPIDSSGNNIFSSVALSTPNNTF